MLWARVEGPAYWGCFVAVFLAVGVWESVQQHSELSVRAERRWRNHGLILLIGSGLNTVLFRISPVAVAAMTSNNSHGVLNRSWPPFGARFVISILLLDLLQYWVHWSYHHVSLLWRIHEVHHSDPDFDVSTAARFHPVEVLWGQGVRLAAIALLAPPVAAVFATELLTLILNLWTHANARIPAPLDGLLRRVFITPDMHRIHHSREAAEQQTNYGQTFSFWDRLFQTYRHTASQGEADFRTGLDQVAGCDTLNVAFMLGEPFRRKTREEQQAAAGPLADLE